MALLARGGRLPRSLWLLLAARAINQVGAFSLSFLTVLVSTDFGAGVATAGLVSAGFGLATIPSRLIGGRLADRLGRRRTIVLGLTGCAAAQLGIAAAGSLAAVAVFAVLLGLAFELYEPPSQAMIADVVGPSERPRAYSLLNAALAAGGMGAGLLAAGLGRWDLRWLFVADALSCLACAVIVRAVLPADRPGQAHPGPAAEGAAGPAGPAGSAGTAAGSAPEGPGEVGPWRDRALIALLITGTGYAVVHLQIVVALPLSLERHGLPPGDAGLLFTVSAVTVVAGQPLVRLRCLSALPAPAALALAHLLLASGLAGYAMADSITVLAATTVLWSLGHLLMMGRSYALVADLAPAGGTGRYLAVYGTIWGIAQVTAPVVGTQILGHAGPGALWWGMAAASAALAAGQLPVARVLAARERRLRAPDISRAPDGRPA